MSELQPGWLERQLQQVKNPRDLEARNRKLEQAVEKLKLLKYSARASQRISVEFILTEVEELLDA